MWAEHLKGWLQGAKLEEDPKEGPANVGAGDDWKALVKLVQAVWDEGTIPTQLGWVVTILVQKEAGIIVASLEGHRTGDRQAARGDCPTRQPPRLPYRAGDWNCGLAHIEQTPFYGVFIDLKKAFDAMDRECCLLILEGHGAGPNMRGLIRHFWDEATNICRASGNYGTPFKSGRGVTQGGPLLAKLFNVVVDAVVREWRDSCRRTWLRDWRRMSWMR
jgi:hypothetical protein